MENVLRQLKGHVEEYRKVHGVFPDYIVMGWDLVYEIRRRKDIYRCTLSREYVYDIPVLETNITGVLALGISCSDLQEKNKGSEHEQKEGCSVCSQEVAI